MEKINDLIPGQILINEDLMKIFKCSGQGGMRRGKRTNSLVLVSNHVQSIYDDRWEGDILYYTGMGTQGDQSFSKSQNRTLYESRKNNSLSVYLFEVFTPKKYTYIGEVTLAKSPDPFFEDQKDELGNLRKVCVFPLKMVNQNTPLIDKSLLDENDKIKKRQIKNIKINELVELAAYGAKKPGLRNVYSTQFQRNQAIIELAKHIAQGVCQLCKENAPFCDNQGKPFLETHHIEWLSNGGSDTIDNVIALCPNCHRKMHILNNKEDVDLLKKTILMLLEQNSLL